MSIVNLSATQLPGVIGQIGFAAGPLAGGTSRYSVLLLGNIIQNSSSAANANLDGYQVYGPDTAVTMQSANDANALFGLGSPLALSVTDFLTLNKNVSLYAAPVRQPTSGGAAATFTLTVTATGASPQSAGSVSVQVGADAPVITSFAATDGYAALIANMVANINATGLLPVTATSSGATLVLTTKVTGARQNFLRVYPKVTSGTGVSFNVNAPTYFTGGTGSDATPLTNLLNSLAVNGQRYYYYVPEQGADSVDGTVFAGMFSTQILALASAPTFMRQRLIGGSVDTLAATEVISTSIGSADPRAEIVCLPTSEVTPFRLAARLAAAYSAVEVPPLTAQDINFDGFGNDALSFALWNVPAPLNGSALSTVSQTSATITGITPLAVTRGGRTAIVKRVTNRFYSAGQSSSTFDGRITDGGKVTICDQFTDDLTAQLVATFPRALIAPDPAQGNPPAIPGVATPGLVKQVVQTLINNYASRGLINGPSTLANLVVVIDPNIGTQIDITVGLFTNNPLHVINLSVLQVQ